MTKTDFHFLPTMIGSMPHTDPKAAVDIITHYLQDIPVWPQLPRRSCLEGMSAQFSQGLPGVKINQDKVWIEPNPSFESELESLYQAYLDNDFNKFPIGAEYAAGLYELASRNLSPLLVKGHITGPLTYCMSIKDPSGKDILYDEVLSDAATKLLKLKATWQEHFLSNICRNTIIFVDEPAMSAYGSAYLPLSREQVTGMFDEVFSGISGLKGVHCCGNTDWSILMDTRVDIINFDTYAYANSLSIYTDELKAFIKRGGAVAWGIVPTDEKALKEETAASLKDRLEAAMSHFDSHGLPFAELARHSLITPACGLGLKSPEAAERAPQLLAELSALLRRKHGTV